MLVVKDIYSNREKAILSKDSKRQKELTAFLWRKAKEAGYPTQADFARSLKISRTNLVALWHGTEQKLSAYMSTPAKVEKLREVVTKLKITPEELSWMMPIHAELFQGEATPDRPAIKQHNVKNYKNPKKVSDLIPLTEHRDIFDIKINSDDIHPNLRKNDVVRLNPFLAEDLQIGKSYFYSEDEIELKIGQYLGNTTSFRVSMLNYLENAPIEIDQGNIVGGIVKISQI